MGLLESPLESDDQVKAKKGELIKLLESLSLEEDKHFLLNDKNDIIWMGPESEHFIHVFSHRGEYGGVKVSFCGVQCLAIKIPKENCLAFYRHLLELNMGFLDVTITIDVDTVLVKSYRPIEDLDKDKLIWDMQMVDQVAKLLRTDVAKEFNAPLVEFK